MRKTHSVLLTSIAVLTAVATAAPSAIQASAVAAATTSSKADQMTAAAKVTKKAKKALDEATAKLAEAKKALPEEVAKISAELDVVDAQEAVAEGKAASTKAEDAVKAAQKVSDQLAKDLKQAALSHEQAIKRLDALTGAGRDEAKKAVIEAEKAVQLIQVDVDSNQKALSAAQNTVTQLKNSAGTSTLISSESKDFSQFDQAKFVTYFMQYLNQLRELNGVTTAVYTTDALNKQALVRANEVRSKVDHNSASGSGFSIENVGQFSGKNEQELAYNMVNDWYTEEHNQHGIGDPLHFGHRANMLTVSGPIGVAFAKQSGDYFFSGAFGMANKFQTEAYNRNVMISKDGKDKTGIGATPLPALATNAGATADKLAAAEKQVTELTAKKAELSKKMDQANRDLANANSNLNNYSNSQSGDKDAISKAKELVTKLEADKKAVEAKVEAAKKVLDTAKADAKKAVEDLTKLQATLDKLAKTVDHAVTKTKAELKAELAKVGERAVEAQKNIDKMVEVVKAAQAEYNAAKKAEDALNTTVTKESGVVTVNYVPGYGIAIWDGYFADHETVKANGQTKTLTHGTSWQYDKVANVNGHKWYCLGGDQWIDSQYVQLGTPAQVVNQKGVLTIDYAPGYGIAVWNTYNANHTAIKVNGQTKTLTHGTSWQYDKVATINGHKWYNLGGNQWVDGGYVKLGQPARVTNQTGVVTIKYQPGYGIAIWNTYNAGRSAIKVNGQTKTLTHGTSWKFFKVAEVNGHKWYNLGGNQWLDSTYTTVK